MLKGSLLTYKKNVSKNKVRKKKFKNFTRQYAFEKKSQPQGESKIFLHQKRPNKVSSFLLNHVIICNMRFIILSTTDLFSSNTKLTNALKNTFTLKGESNWLLLFQRNCFKQSFRFTTLKKQRSLTTFPIWVSFPLCNFIHPLEFIILW